VTYKRRTYRVFWSDEDRRYIATCEGLPSLVWMDPDPEEALRGLRALLTDMAVEA
jgi:hypothetical protein